MTDESKTYPHTEEHKAKGDWNPLWEQFRELDPDFLEAYLAFRSVPRHIQNALKAGASMEEILETIQLTTVMGIHSCNLAIPILMEEVSKFEE